MQEQRLYPRFSVDAIDIYGKIMYTGNVKILNISIGGVLVALLETDRKINPGNPCALKLEGKDIILTLQGTVVRSELNEDHKDPQGRIIPVYSTGLQFMNLSGKKTRELVDFIGKYIISSQRKQGFKEDDTHKMSGLRHFVRFNIDTPENAILFFYDSFKVKQLGFGGMCIESDQVYENEKILPMEINLPENRGITVLGRVVQTLSVSDVELEKNEVGIEFIKISGESKQRLAEFISSLPDKDSISS